MLGLLAAGWILVPPALERILLAYQRDHLEAMTSVAAGTVDYYVHAARSGRLSDAEAKRRAAARIRSMRYGPHATGYYWIQDRSPRMIMHPFRPDLEGRDVGILQDQDRKYLFAEMVAVVSARGHGFIDYRWQWLDDASRVGPKLSHLRLVPEWDWIVGTGAYVEDAQAAFARMTRGFMRVWSALMAAILLLYGHRVYRSHRTERRRREAESHLVREQDLNAQLIQASPALILLLNPDGTLALANDTVHERFHSASRATVGAHFARTVLPASERRRFEEACRRAAAQKPAQADRCSGPVTFRTRIATSPSNHRLIEWRLRRLPRPSAARDGREYQILAIGLDITARHRAVRRLKAHRARLRRLTSHLMSAEDRQRRHIAADLHDQVGQNLAAARFHLTQLEADCTQPAHREMVRSTRSLIKQTMRETTSLQFELCPPMLYELGLERALEWYLDLVREKHGLRTELRELDPLPDLPANVRGMLFQSTRELIRNVVRHARAQSLRVTLRVAPRATRQATAPATASATPQATAATAWAARQAPSGGGRNRLGSRGRLIVVVRDDGCGFDPAVSRASALQPTGTADATHGFGLFGLQERLRTIGGQLDIQSTPGHGTAARILIPLPLAIEGPTGTAPRESSDDCGTLQDADDHHTPRDIDDYRAPRTGVRPSTKE